MRELRVAELDPLEALCAKNMGALQHPGAFVVLVVLLVADGTFSIHRFLRGGAGARSRGNRVPLLHSLDNIPCHCRRKGLDRSVMTVCAFWTKISEKTKAVGGKQNQVYQTKGATGVKV